MVILNVGKNVEKLGYLNIVDRNISVEDFYKIKYIFFIQFNKLYFWVFILK